MIKTVLCVEDNLEVQMCNKPLLESKGFTVKLAMTLREARDAVNEAMPDLIILDIHLPDGNGLDFLRELQKTSDIPVIALTNNKEEQDVVAGLSSGCDAYIPKPYTLPVLLAHIETVLRRAGQVPEAVTKGLLSLNPVAGQAFLNGEDLLLSQKEYSILLMFIQHEEKPMSADFIYEKVWGQPMTENSQALRTTVSRLRTRLQGSGYTIVNQKNEGYCFERE
jgi:DNA-binding response OmpR family regulator